MGLNPKRAVMFADNETTFGTDALSALSPAALAAFALPVINPRPTQDVALLDRNVARGTKGQSPKAVGRGTAGLTFDMELVGSADPTNTPPPWTNNAPAAGCQVGAGTLCNLVHSVGEVFWQGELVFGAVLVPTDWKDAEVGSGGEITTADPGVDKACILYPDGKTRNSPEAIAGSLRVITSGDTILVRLDAGVDVRPLATWHIVVDNDGSGTDDKFNQLTLDMPVGVVLYPEANTTTSTFLYVWTASGAFTAAVGSEHTVVGQQSLTEAEISSAPAAYGTLVRPDSEQQIAFTVTGPTWSGADPVAGDEIIEQNDPSNTSAGGLVEAYAAGVVTVRSYWGGFTAGGTVVVVGTGSTGTIDGTGPVQTRTPSRSSYTDIETRRHYLFGSRYNFTIAAQAGEAALISFTAQGTAIDPASVSPPTISVPIETPPRWQNGVASFGGNLLRTESMSFETNSTLADVADANSPEGVAGVDLTERDPGCSFTVETAGTIPGAGDWEKAMGDGDWRSCGFAWIAGARKVALTIPRMQIESAPTQGDDVLQSNVSARCREIVADDEFFIFVF